MRAESEFEITGWEETEWHQVDGINLRRARVSKSFTGAVVGTSVAELLMCHGPNGPLAYTAQEQFTGTVGDRTGGFAAQHGAMSADGDQPGPWLLLVGTGGLAGITGTATLVVTDGHHRLTLDYEVPPSS